MEPAPPATPAPASLPAPPALVGLCTLSSLVLILSSAPDIYYVASKTGPPLPLPFLAARRRSWALMLVDSVLGLWLAVLTKEPLSLWLRLLSLVVAGVGLSAVWRALPAGSPDRAAFAADARRLALVAAVLYVGTHLLVSLVNTAYTPWALQPLLALLPPRKVPAGDAVPATHLLGKVLQAPARLLGHIGVADVVGTASALTSAAFAAAPVVTLYASFWAAFKGGELPAREEESGLLSPAAAIGLSSRHAALNAAVDSVSIPVASALALAAGAWAAYGVYVKQPYIVFPNLVSGVLALAQLGGVWWFRYGREPVIVLPASPAGAARGDSGTRGVSATAASSGGPAPGQPTAQVAGAAEDTTARPGGRKPAAAAGEGSSEEAPAPRRRRVHREA